MLSRKMMVKGIPSIDHPNQLCEGCLLGKQSRRSFPKENVSRASEPLQLVHLDVCRPINPPSLGKNHYFLTFINDFSWKMWVIFSRKNPKFLEFSRWSGLLLKSKVGMK